MIASTRKVYPSLGISFSVDDEPDPRLPVRPVDVALWTYGEPGWLGLEARPALPLPPESIVEQVSSGRRVPVRAVGVEALLVVARRDEPARPAVVEALLRSARRALNPPTYQHAIRPAARALLEIPGVSGEVSTEMQRLLD